jgi:hypothetical protein
LENEIWEISNCYAVYDIDHIKLNNNNTIILKPYEQYSALFSFDTKKSPQYMKRIDNIFIEWNFSFIRFAGDYENFFKGNLISNEIEVINKKMCDE